MRYIESLSRFVNISDQKSSESDVAPTLRVVQKRNWEALCTEDTRWAYPLVHHVKRCFGRCQRRWIWKNRQGRL